MARAVLAANRAGDGTATWTKPSAAQYPHQWNWDSGFVALGLATFDPRSAMAEVESMLRARWADGMVPHLRYDREHLADYFPGPDRWPGAAGRVAEPGALTSGISNPPVLVLGALAAARAAGPEGAAFARRASGPLTAWLRWFLDSRRLATSPMPVSVHPWEGGWDNSPRWDFLAAAGLRPQRPYRRLDTVHVAAAERPTGRDYDAYIALAEIIDGAGYDIAEVARRSPFCVHDVVVDALWWRAAAACVELAGIAGGPAPFTDAELDRFAADFEAVHWDEEAEAYVDVDALSGRRLSVPTAAGPAATGAGIADPDRVRRQWRRYAKATAGLTPVATAGPAAPGYDPGRYWRGPAWANVNWLCAQGLDAARLPQEARSLRERTIAMASGAMAEYFDAAGGEGRGSSGFSWTAAVVLLMTGELTASGAAS